MNAAARRPLSLQAQAETEAHSEHSRRLAELTALTPLLQQLDALRPALAERGLTVYPSSITLSYEYLSPAGYAGPRSKVLRLATDIIFNRGSPSRWLAALRELGLRVVKADVSHFGSALLRKGSLLIRIGVSEADADALAAWTHTTTPPSTAPAAAQPQAVAA